MENKNKIIPQMFDVRPVINGGALDLKKINEVAERAGMKKKQPVEIKLQPDVFEPAENLKIAIKNKKPDFHIKNDYFDEIRAEKEFFEDFEKKYRRKKNLKILCFSFAGAISGIILFIFISSFIRESLAKKDSLISNGKNGYAFLAQAKDGILNKNFSASSLKFSEAYENFNEITSEINQMGGTIADVARFIPYLSKFSSGKYLAEAGRDISRIGILFSEVAEKVNNQASSGNEGHFLEIFKTASENSREALALADNISKNLDKVNFEDVPSEQRAELSNLKSKLPEIRRFLAEFVSDDEIFTDILGGNGPRKYLFLFQNNNEMRATGGFVGTYGVLDVFNGRIRNFFIDGIFNPDGQLKEKVVPPFPIQKISAAWSLHDSNWFPDFPVSAEKAIWFYEKTGGPTVDGVIAMTPEILKKFLEITGPIEMPEYEVTIDSDNFLTEIQREVEIDYDKELNQPKKILADLAPKVLDKIFNVKSLADIKRVAEVLNESLNEKQILIYSRNYAVENKLSQLAWSGELLDTEKDYLSVINTNINGFKTDGIIDETIEHAAEILPDGSIMDTLTITRKHNGGNTPYEWWNKVNADYLRVYVPKGSQLLSAEGQTREFDPPPLDYDALGFKRDPQVMMEEDSIRIDEESGTRVYEDAGKTVFGNWTYVSPQETLVLKYKYLLPFKLQFGGKNSIDSYSLLAQKQSGSVGSKFVSTLSYPAGYKVAWKYPEGISADKNILKTETDLKTDKFTGVAFSK